jgi:hypothetical protein
MGERRGAYRVLVGTAEGQRPLGIRRRRWGNNIKVYLKEIERENVEWINLAEDGHTG